MSQSSATAPSAAEHISERAAATSENPFPASGTPAIELPTFGRYDAVRAASSRHAARLNAAQATDEERNKLLEERAALLDKKFAGSLLAEEANRLEYVRWSLDRIDDARFGASLDEYDALVSQYESFADDLNMLLAQLKNLGSSK